MNEHHNLIDIPDTIEKFREASFFFDLLSDSYKNKGNDKNASRHFNYYLSAFISSARSITWIMRKEYKYIKGWEKWFNEKKLSKEEEDFLKKINDIRIRSEKIEPLRASVKADFTFEATEKNLEKIKSLEGKECVFLTEDELMKYDKNAVNNESYVRVKCLDLKVLYPTLKEFPDNNIIQICRKYLLLIGEIVKECLETFGHPKYNV